MLPCGAEDESPWLAPEDWSIPLAVDICIPYCPGDEANWFGDVANWLGDAANWFGDAEKPLKDGAGDVEKAAVDGMGVEWEYCCCCWNGLYPFTLTCRGKVEDTAPFTSTRLPYPPLPMG